MNLTCPICMTKTKQRIGFISSHCSHCGQYYDHEGWRGYYVYKRRMALKMKRRDFAALLGIKRKTLANCETHKCSDRVYEKSIELFKAPYKFPKLENPK